MLSFDKKPAAGTNIAFRYPIFPVISLKEKMNQPIITENIV